MFKYLPSKVYNALIDACLLYTSGDGRIFVIPIEDAIRIRTAERGDIALYNAEQDVYKRQEISFPIY